MIQALLPNSFSLAVRLLNKSMWRGQSVPGELIVIHNNVVARPMIRPSIQKRQAVFGVFQE